MTPEADCSSCVPRLRPENQTPLSIYDRVSGQHIMGFSGPVDLNHVALFDWLDAYDVLGEERIRMADLIIQAYRMILKMQMDKAEQEKE
jgi:hypothetical protein